mmetsp:Transcript_26785/g.70380  ORF Transcript_26785/g.70380 Transcript_26785/m.70380 type:complete len:264 (-) Transcript_26785:763-1554(-)
MPCWSDVRDGDTRAPVVLHPSAPRADSRTTTTLPAVISRLFASSGFNGSPGIERLILDRLEPVPLLKRRRGLSVRQRIGTPNWRRTRSGSPGTVVFALLAVVPCRSWRVVPQWSAELMRMVGTSSKVAERASTGCQHLVTRCTWNVAKDPVSPQKIHDAEGTTPSTRLWTVLCVVVVDRGSWDRGSGACIAKALTCVRTASHVSQSFTIRATSSRSCSNRTSSGVVFVCLKVLGYVSFGVVVSCRQASREHRPSLKVFVEGSL